MTGERGRRRVVIAGAGFGGLAAARRLEREPFEVTIVDRNNFHTFLPLLYQVATAGLNAADVAYAVRGVFQRRQRVGFRQGTVTGVDWESGKIQIEGAPGLGFDNLIIASGSVPNFFGLPGAEAHSFPLYSLADATRLRNHVLRQFEAADTEPELVEQGALDFVVVGGGPTGVEVAGSLAELIDRVLSRDFHTLDVRRARIVILEASDRLLPAFHPRSQSYAQQTLAARGVEVRRGEAVASVGPTSVELASGEVITTRTVVWAAGVQAGSLAARLGVEQGRAGRIAVEPDLSLPDHPEAFAVGDVADIDDGRGGRLPQLARVAIRGGRHAADQIIGDVEGRVRRPFRYRDPGTMATIGRRAAVAELPWAPPLRGLLAWVAWLVLHLVELLGMRNRLSVLVNWAWNYLTWDRGPRLIFAGAGEDSPDETPSTDRTGPQ